jgi:hypothetical protein
VTPPKSNVDNVNETSHPARTREWRLHASLSVSHFASSVHPSLPPMGGSLGLSNDAWIYLSAWSLLNSTRPAPQYFDQATRIEPLYAVQGQAAKEEGRKKGGGDRRSANAKTESSKTSTKVDQDDSKRTAHRAAASTGYSATSLHPGLTPPARPR